MSVAKIIDGQTASPEQLLRGRVRHSSVDANGGQDGRENDATGTLNARQIDDAPIAYLDPKCISYRDHSQLATDFEKGYTRSLWC